MSCRPRGMSDWLGLLSNTSVGSVADRRTSGTKPGRRQWPRVGMTILSHANTVAGLVRRHMLGELNDPGEKRMEDDLGREV